MPALRLGIRPIHQRPRLGTRSKPPDRWNGNLPWPRTDTEKRSNGQATALEGFATTLEHENDHMEATTFDSWAIVEIMGHQRFAGRVTEQTVGGCSFVRIDVPPIDDKPAFTKLFGQAAIFSITPTDEQTAVRAAASFRTRPVEIYELPPRTALPQYNEEDDDHEDFFDAE